MEYNDAAPTIENPKFGLNWYKLYTYIKLPLSFIGGFFVMYMVLKPLLDEYYFRLWMTPYLIPWLVLVVLYAFTFVGLLRLTYWGFRSNQILLIVETVLLSYGFFKYIDSILFAILFFVVWGAGFAATNLIYFNKIKDLFPKQVVVKATPLETTEELTEQEAEANTNITEEPVEELEAVVSEETTIKADDAVPEKVKEIADVETFEELTEEQAEKATNITE